MAADVAIIGMAGRLPGSPDLDEFWDHLVAGDDLVDGDPGRPLGLASARSRRGRARARWGGFVDRRGPLRRRVLRHLAARGGD